MDGTLVASSATVFTDDSGRNPYTSVYVMTRLGGNLAQMEERLTSIFYTANNERGGFSQAKRGIYRKI